jgi:hypothetical protein
MPIVERIYNEYRAASEYPPDYTLDYFARNTILFNNIKSFEDENELKLYVQLIWQYLNAFYKKSRYNDTLNTAAKYLKTIDSEIDRLKAISTKDDWYNGIHLFREMAAYQLRDYKTATHIFKYLNEKDPRNENYINWLRYSCYGQNIWISQVITIVCGLILVIAIFFGDYFPNMLVIVIEALAVIVLFATWIYDYYQKRSFRKSTSER